jgi:hypothetical protein
MHVPHIACVGAVLVSACGATPRVPLDPVAADQQLRQLEYTWAAATKNRSDSALRPILADDWYLIGPHGNVISRQDMLGIVRGNTDVIDTTEFFDVRSHLFDTVAVLTGGAREIGTRAAGRRYNEPYRWTDVFVYRDGRWQALVSQATLLPPASQQP